jgi:hypothetical protein
MEVRLPVFSVRQPIGPFYVGVIRADDLLRICKFDYRRMQYRNDYAEYLGIQRKLNENRVFLPPLLFQLMRNVQR